MKEANIISLLIEQLTEIRAFTLTEDQDHFNKKGDEISISYLESDVADRDVYNIFLRCHSTNPEIDGSDQWSLQWFIDCILDEKMERTDGESMERLNELVVDLMMAWDGE